MYITLRDKEPFTFAGLWDTWRDAEGQQVRTCTIITTEPNELVASIHTRMPVILPPEAREEWLDPGHHDDHILLTLLARPVSRLVNNRRYEGAELIA